MVRIAAVGDIHLGEDSAGTFRPHLDALASDADVFLLAGDLTRCGTVAEIDVVIAEIADVGVPVVAVLGNHDHHSDEADALTARLRRRGIIVLEGDGVELDLPGGRLGVAGTKGFGNGFPGAQASAFGEPIMKAFVRAAEEAAESLAHALEGLRSDVRLALTHYSPIEATLRGERPEIYPFLGSYLLAEAIDTAGAQLALHGHAHAGAARGVTPGGVDVRNVARPVLRAPYALFRMREPAARLT